MRLWTLHPQYLDRQGLLALWRETLLARNVLSGNTRGYKNHPQLLRFKQAPYPAAALDFYLAQIYAEAQRRGYRFDASKFVEPPTPPAKIPVTSGQLHYEFLHLMRKLRRRSPSLFAAHRALTELQPHDLFVIVAGQVEPWEVIK